MMRFVNIGCLVMLLFGCASKNIQQLEDSHWTGADSASPSAQPPNPAATRESEMAHTPSTSASANVPPPLETPAASAAAGKVQQLGEISSDAPGAADVRRGPCNLDTCAVVLGIAVHDVAQSIAEDDGSPGLYMPQGMYSAETADQTGVWDAYGIQKIIRVWDISLLPRDGQVRVIEQRNEPLFRVGDPVLLDGNAILPWN